MRSIYSISMSIVALALLVLSTGCLQSGSKSTGTAGTSATTGGGAAAGAWTGDAKDFAFTTFAGASGKASDFAGKPLVLNFWAAW